MSCGAGRRCGLDLALLCLWCRPAAEALIKPLAWEPPHAMGAVLTRKKKKRIKGKGEERKERREEGRKGEKKERKKERQKDRQTDRKKAGRPKKNPCLVNKYYVGNFFFLLFRATSSAYGVSQARGLIGATAAGLHHSHSNTGPEPRLRPTHSSWQHRILNLLSEARDRTYNFMVPSRIHFRCAMTGTPS